MPQPFHWTSGTPADAPQQPNQPSDVKQSTWPFEDISFFPIELHTEEPNVDRRLVTTETALWNNEKANQRNQRKQDIPETER